MRGNLTYFSYYYVYLYLNLLIPQYIKKHTCCLILDLRNNYLVV